MPQECWRGIFPRLSGQLADPLYDDGYPALHDAANLASLRGQKHFLWALRVRLGALVGSALGGAAFIGSDLNWVGGLIAVSGFVIALGCDAYTGIEKPERQWYEGRAAAESAKTLAWRYAVRGESFDGLNDSEADRAFAARIRELLQDLGELELAGSTADAEQISVQMRDIRARSFEDRRDIYCDGRIEDQRSWYSDKSAINAGHRKKWLLAASVTQIIGVLTGLLIVADIISFDSIGLLAAVAATMTSWSQAKQFSNLATAYGITAQELATIKSEIASVPEPEWSDYVGQAEEAISREHTLWRASRGVKIARNRDR